MLKKFQTIKTIALIICFFVISFFIYNLPVLANDSNKLYFTPQIAIPNSDINGKVEVSSPDQDGNLTSSLIARYVSAIYDYGLSIAGILAAIMLMAGGIIWLTSGGDSGKVEQAKKIIIGSITGIFILFGSYIILNTINPDLVEMKGVPLIVPENINFRYLTCCHPEDGKIKYKVREVDGKMIATEGDKKGEEVSCATGYAECGPLEVCTAYGKAGLFFCAPDLVCCECSWYTLGVRNTACGYNYTEVGCAKYCGGKYDLLRSAIYYTTYSMETHSCGLISPTCVYTGK